MATKYTPELIVEGNQRFSIPIYQRLFEWDEENVEALLDDLYRAYTNNQDEDYYIGLLTSTSDGDLVDGQQRFTVMTLIGCVLSSNVKTKSAEWKSFISPGSPRLQFKSRPKDVAYLTQVMQEETWDEESKYVNYKMKRALDTIESYINTLDNAADFAKYIYRHLCFFISKLPKQYSVRNLNKYFERMNSTGNNLEQHEILKVKLIRNMPGNIPQLMQLWNRISDVDKLLISARRHRNETEDEFRNRRISILNSEFDVIFRNNLINGIAAADGIDMHSSMSIREIKPSDVKPKQRVLNIKDSASVLPFPIILLLTLYWKLVHDGRREEINSLKDFFNPANLLDVFSKYLPFEGLNVNDKDIEDFMYRLLRARLILDYCFIRSTEYGYKLEMNESESEGGQILLMFESMLYVSSNRYSYYRWFVALMDAVCGSRSLPDVRTLYRVLKSTNDEENPLLPYESLHYGEDIRYWFWRLDFHIWLHRNDLFKGHPESLQIAESYRFVRNRSIEHVAPQTPMQESNLKWDDTDVDRTLMNSFGNLVMISNGLNSSLRNQPYEVKKAYVQAYINGSMNGSIESLSLLLLNTLYDVWDKESIEKYGHTTYELLIKSYF